MIKYTHQLIAWGKAYAECLSEGRPYSPLPLKGKTNG